MSVRNTVAPFEKLTGMSLSASIVGGIALVRTVYWVLPIFAVPPDRVRFWALTAVTTCSGVRPLSRSLVGSMATMIGPYFPPAGHGKGSPGLGALIRPSL